MGVSENLLFTLARYFYTHKGKKASNNKRPVKNMDDYDKLRYTNVGRIIDSAKRHNISLENKIIVDLGCKDGALSSGYIKFGAKKVTGIDIDAPMIDRANKLYASPNINFVLNTPNSIPIEDNYADLVVSFDVFEHIADPKTIVDELYRITKPGGEILIGTWSWYHPFAPHIRSTMPVPWAHVFFSEKTMLRTCRRVYLSDWYKPTLSDLNEKGEKISSKYTNESIPTDYLNKYFIKDFEKVFNESDFRCATELTPFNVSIARKTKFILKLPYLREFLAGYAWFILTK